MDDHDDELIGGERQAIQSGIQEHRWDADRRTSAGGSAIHADAIDTTDGELSQSSIRPKRPYPISSRTIIVLLWDSDYERPSAYQLLVVCTVTADDIPAYRKRPRNRRKRILRDSIAWRPLRGLLGLPPILLMSLHVLRIGRRMLTMSSTPGGWSGQRGHTE